MLDKTNTGFPYGCLLTKIFEFCEVDFDEYDKVEATYFLDEKSLNQSDIFMVEDGTLYQMSPETQSGPSMIMPSSTPSDSQYTEHVNKMTSDRSRKASIVFQTWFKLSPVSRRMAPMHDSTKSPRA